MEGGYKNSGDPAWNPSYKAWARNFCSHKGKMVVKLDIKYHKDKTLYLTGFGKKRMNGKGHLRGIYYCKDLSRRANTF